jgi:hypothetical protein
MAFPSPLTVTVGPNRSAWWRPIVSPEHGAYVVLLVSFLTGVAAAQNWTVHTTLALLCALLGLQAEHPLIMQIRQRKSLKPRLLLWAGLYGGTALLLASYLYWQSEAKLPLLGIYGAAIGALVFDGIAVLHREQKTVLNESITFASTCLAAPLAIVVTQNSLGPWAIGLWGVNALFFTSSIFTVKLRKLLPKDSTTAIWRLVLYHGAATGLVVGLYALQLLPLFTALSFGIALAKAGLVLGCRHWYVTTAIRSVAMIETVSALLFGIVVSLSLLWT